MIIGEAPATTEAFVIEGGRTVTKTTGLASPAAGEVVVEVAGSAVGVAPGAEVAGTVIATGDAAAEWMGRRVVVPRVLPCGECDRCRRARASACPHRMPRGAVARHLTVPAHYLLSVEPPLWPVGVSLWQMAALADAAAAPYHALVRAQLGPGDLCVVIGGGVRGRFATRIARAKGAHVAVIEGDARRRALAETAGARWVLDGETSDAAGLRAVLDGEARAAGLRMLEWKVLETSGSAAGRRRALELLGDGDTAALLGDGDGNPVNAPLDWVVEKEAQVVGAAACHPDLYPELAALVVRGDLPLADEVTALSFDALADAVEAVRRGAELRLPILVASSTGGAG